MTSVAFGNLCLPPKFKMAESESLNYWRKFFSCANADIFQVIKYAILVASADFPTEFLSWRDQITEIIYTCWSVRQCSSDRIELQTPELVGDKERKRCISEENEPTMSNDQSTSSRHEYSNLDEFEALTNEIEEEQQTVGEVLRIKEVLANWKEESEKVLSESLRRLQLMELSIETLGATQIGRAVSGLHKHKSKPIRQLAQTLVKCWKLLAEEWVNATAASHEPSPVPVDPSPSHEESLLPSELDFPPLDMGAILATQTASFEFSKIFEGIDDDGNPTSNGEAKKNGRKPQQKAGNSARKENEEIQKDKVLPKAPKPRDANHNASNLERTLEKATACGSSEQWKKTQDHSGEVRRQEVAPRVPKQTDASCKTSKPQDIPSPSVARATTHRNTQQRQVTSSPCPSRKHVSRQPEELSYRAKLELAKRKLHDRYQEANNAKRQRTIQVMELKDLPKQSQNKQQPIVKRGSHFKRSMNMKSK